MDVPLRLRVGGDAHERVDLLGFEVRTDFPVADGRRWLTIGHPAQPAVELAVMLPAAPLPHALAAGIQDAQTVGAMFGVGLASDDLDQDYQDLAAKGVRFLMAPAARPFGAEAILTDPSGNRVFIVEYR